MLTCNAIKVSKVKLVVRFLIGCHGWRQTCFTYMLMDVYDCQRQPRMKLGRITEISSFGASLKAIGLSPTSVSAMIATIPLK
jgi:hypothetical protein